MNYTLAKELKDAGFPQGRPLVRRPYIPDTKFGFISAENFKQDDGVYIPTLPELIEELGDDFIGVYKSTKLVQVKEIEGCWRAEGLFEEPDTLSVEGETPEEAVAKLWLALNKKD